MGALGSLLLAFLTLGAPIGVALCAATVAFILYDPFLSENAIFRSFFSFVNKYTLMAIPFFIYAGFLMERTGLIKKLFRFADALVGWVPGGFAYATILSAVMFGAISGSSTAMAAAMGLVAYPEMVKRGYPKWMAAGVIASAGGIALLIPPSITLILFGVITEISIGADGRATITSTALSGATYAIDVSTDLVHWDELSDNEIGAEGKLTHDQLLTDPEEAAEFVKATEVDALAIACGTSHGAYKFTRPPTGDILAIDRIKDIHARIPNTHLVMHGSSAVPQDWLAIINEYGGEIPETYGVPVEQVTEGIKHGVRKVNIDTDLRLAATGSIRRFLAQNPSEFDPRKYLKESLTAMRDICIARYESFGTAGNASKLRPLSLAAVQEAYVSGAL